MAAKRLSKSAVNWAKFSDMTPPKYSDCVRQLKVKSDIFTGRVNLNPAELKPIDFASYKALGVNAALVESMEKGYKGLQVPYPKDTKDLHAQISEFEKTSLETSKQTVVELNGLKNVLDNYLQWVEKVPTEAEMTMEMYYDYFPDPDQYEDKLYEPYIKFVEDNGGTVERELGLLDQIFGIPDRVRDGYKFHTLTGEYQDDYKKANPDEFPEWYEEQKKLGKMN